MPQASRPPRVLISRGRSHWCSQITAVASPLASLLFNQDHLVVCVQRCLHTRPLIHTADVCLLFAGQNANVGMLPPSDSEDDDEEEEEKPAPVKAKQVNEAHISDVVLLLASHHLC